MRYFLKTILVCILFFSVKSVSAQSSNYIRNVVINVDTLQFSLKEHAQMINEQNVLPFRFSKGDETIEFKVFLKRMYSISEIKLISSPSFEVVEDPFNFNDDYYKFKLRFSDLIKSDFLSVNFAIWTLDGEEIMQQIQLFPITETRLELADHKYENRKLYIGEERVFEIISNHPDNIRVDNLWKEQNELNYRVTEKNGKLFLHLIPQKLKKYNLSFRLTTYKPNMIFDHIQYETNPINISFEVKKSRLAFLKTDRKDITLDPETQLNGIELQIQNHRSLLLQKTYRIEAQEKKGGALVGELFTRALLGNDKILCHFRPYANHVASTGYLYIKDGDRAKFITNFSVSPKTEIHKINILHRGRNWTPSLSVNPGETIEVKIEGQALLKGDFQFEGVTEVKNDSLLRTNEIIVMRLNIPMDINHSSINIYNHGLPTGRALQVREYQRPRDFDFVSIEYDGATRTEVDKIEKPIFYFKSIRDIMFYFNPTKLDQDNILYGKQYIEMDIKVIGRDRKLTEIRKVERIVVCPDVNSPRYHNYDKRDCASTSVSLNSILAGKTYYMEEWSRVEIDIKHKRDKYSEPIKAKKVVVYVARKSSFDIDVSFPAGLLVKKANEDDISGLGGVSIAAIAQFKFYKPGTIAQLRPYRIGIGSIALNAFDLKDDVEGNNRRDLGIVSLLSVHPLYRPGRKLSLPIYFGFGYLIKADTWFVMLGPGIRVRL